MKTLKLALAGAVVTIAGATTGAIAQDGPTVGELVAGVRERVTDPPETLEDEVIAFVVDLQARELVVMAPPQS